MDGKMMPEPLDMMGKTPKWLMDELEKQQLNLQDIFLGQVDSYGELTVDLYADNVQVPQPQEKPEVYALLKNAKPIWKCSDCPLKIKTPKAVRVVLVPAPGSDCRVKAAAHHLKSGERLYPLWLTRQHQTQQHQRHDAYRHCTEQAARYDRDEKSRNRREQLRIACQRGELAVLNKQLLRHQSGHNGHRYMI